MQDFGRVLDAARDEGGNAVRKAGAYHLQRIGGNEREAQIGHECAEGAGQGVGHGMRLLSGCHGPVRVPAPRSRFVCAAALRKYLVQRANAIGYGSRMGPLRWPHSRGQGGYMQTKGAQVAANSKPMSWQDEVYDLLRRHDVTQFAYVPDAGHRILIDRSL